MPYGFYITDKGRELIDQAIPNEKKVDITKACFGSGGNPDTDREYGITELKNQFYEKTLTPETDTYQVDEKDPYSLYIRTIVPDEVTGTINEVGYKDSEDNLIIYGVVQKRIKEKGVGGGGFKIQYDNWIKLENGDADKIEVKVLSPEYERVDKLVEDTKKDFQSQLESAQSTITELCQSTKQEIEQKAQESSQSLTDILDQAETDFDISSYVQKDGDKVLVSPTDVTQITTNKDNINSIQNSLKNKVDKEEGKSLVSDSDITQITTNKTDIESLKSKVTDKSEIEDLTGKLNNKVDKVEGSSLATTAQLTQIETNKTDIASLKTDKADKSQLTGLATESYVDNKVENLGDLKGSCLKSELEDKKAECKANDMYIVTDDDNHIYFYNGTDWTDTSAKAHVDLSNYYDKGTIDSSLSNKVDKVSGKELVSTTDITQITTNKTDIASLKTGKVDKVEGSSLATSAQLTQIETNKTNITSLQSGKVDKVSGKELVSTSDITQITTNKNSIATIESDLSELATFLNTYA